MVSDGQVDPDYILKLYSLYTKRSVDLVKIWRTSRENANRLVISRSYNFIARLLFGFASRDINATPKILSTERMRSLRLRSPNIALDVELLSKLAVSGGKWTEIPVPAGKREGGASTTNFASALEMMIALVRLRFA